MTREVLGNACAYIPGKFPGAKPSYVKLGIAFKEDNRISIKLDATPLPGTGWQGWVNILPTSKFAPKPPPPEEAPMSAKAKTGFDGVDPDDDIPF